MASEIRVNKINSQTGVGTITLSPTGVDISGITTASTLRATTGIITTLQVGTISGDGSSLTGIAATDNVRTGILDVAGVGTFRNDVNIPDKIIHLGDTDTAIRFPAANTVSVETGGSERARFDSSGRLLVGHNVSIGADRHIQLVGNSADESTIEVIRQSADANAPKLDLSKSRNATKGSNTVVQNNDSLGEIHFRGDDGSDLFSAGATIVGTVDGTPGNNSVPGALLFRTTAQGEASTTERLRITNAGAIGLSGANYGTSGQVLKSQGSSSAPQWATPAAWVYGTAADYDQWGSLTDVQFTGWPSTWQEIRVSFINISVNSGSKIQFFVSKSSSTAARITSGYQNTSGYYGSGTGVASVQDQGQFHGTESAAYQMNGYVSFYKFNGTVIRYEGQLVNKTDTYIFHTNGFVTCDPTTSMTHIFFRGTGASYDSGMFKLDYLST